MPFAAFAQIVPAQNQVTIAPYGGLVMSTSSTATRKLEQLIGNTFGQLTYWTGARWDLIATSSLGISGTVTNINTTYPILGGPITTTGTLTFGGLSTTTPWTSGQIAYVSTDNLIASAATTTASCTGSVSCTAFTIIGGTPITITGTSGITAYDAWTHPQAGTSATTSGMIFSAASSTFVGGLSMNTATITRATTTNLFVTNAPTFSTLTSALLQTGVSGLLAEYAGTSCTNQFVRALSALGIATCETVSLTADVTGTLPVANGGTGATTFPSGVIYGNGTSALFATSSPTVGWITATTTTATSTFAGNAHIFGNLRVDGNFFAPVSIVSSGNATINGNLNVTGVTTLATSLSGLAQLTSGVVSAITGTTGQVPYYSGTNVVSATSTLFINTTSFVGVGSTSPSQKLGVNGSAFATNFWDCL